MISCMDAWGIADGYWDVDGEYHPTPGQDQGGAARRDGRPGARRPGVVRPRRQPSPAARSVPAGARGRVRSRRRRRARRRRADRVPLAAPDRRWSDDLARRPPHHLPADAARVGRRRAGVLPVAARRVGHRRSGRRRRPRCSARRSRWRGPPAQPAARPGSLAAPAVLAVLPELTTLAQSAAAPDPRAGARLGRQHARWADRPRHRVGRQAPRDRGDVRGRAGSRAVAQLGVGARRRPDVVLRLRRAGRRARRGLALVAGGRAPSGRRGRGCPAERPRPHRPPRAGGLDAVAAHRGAGRDRRRGRALRADRRPRRRLLSERRRRVDPPGPVRPARRHRRAT